MGGGSPLHWLIMFVVTGLWLVIPITIIILLLILVRQHPSGPNLVRCPDCNQPVSRLAVNCSHCGRPPTPVC